jgi:uncharacterized lipoprotein YbaY
VALQEALQLHLLLTFGLHFDSQDISPAAMVVLRATSTMMSLKM